MWRWEGSDAAVAKAAVTAVGVNVYPSVGVECIVSLEEVLAAMWKCRK